MPDKERELKACPSGENTKHTPYVMFWDDKHEELICPTAKVSCTCGFQGPERYGENCQEEAIQAWNTRPQPVSGDFEEYLREIFIKQTHFHSDLEQEFIQWLDTFQIDDWFKYVKEYQAHFTGVGGKK